MAQRSFSPHLFMPWLHREWVPAAQAPCHWLSQSVLLWVELAGTSVEYKCLSLWLPSFFDHFPSHFSGSYLSSLECLICSLRTFILLAKILPLFVYNSAIHMLGNTVDPSSFAMVTCRGHSFVNSAHSLDVYSITFLVDSHVCMWPKKQLHAF